MKTISGKQVTEGSEVDIIINGQRINDAYIDSFGERNGQETVGYEYREGAGWASKWAYISEITIVTVHEN
jgi:hypothetical protein